jgi:plastocyanin
MTHEEDPPQAQAESPPEPGDPVRSRRLVGALALVALAGHQTDGASLAASQSLLPAVQPAARPPLALPGAEQGAGGLPQPVAAAQPYAAATKQVMIMNYAFSPASMSVNVGDTVVWTNQDSAPHTVTVSSGPANFSSATLQKGQTFSFKFAKAGTYSYYCSVHPDMKATVTVAGSSAPPPTNPAPPTSPAPPTGHGPPAAPAPPATGQTPPASGAACAALDTTVQTLLRHVYGAHLEESPVQQVTDLLNINQYTLTHTTLVEHMIEPQVAALSTGVVGLLTPLLTHLYTAHLEESPFQQVADLTNLDQYVKTHTVLIETMLQPLLNAELGSC